MKRFLVVFIILLVLVAGIGIIYTQLPETGKIKHGRLELVPEDAAIILNIKDFNKFAEAWLTGNKLWAEVDSLPAFWKIDSTVLVLQKAIAKNTSLKTLFSSRASILSLHQVGHNDFGTVFYVDINGFFNEKSVNETINNTFFEGKATVSTKSYSGINSYAWKYKDIRFYTSVVKNVLVLSRRELLLQNVMRQATTNYNLFKDSNFKAIVKTAGKNALANMYINFSYFPKILAKEMASPWQGTIKQANLGDWMELDLTVKPTFISLNGFMLSNDSLFRYANIFKAQKPIDYDMETIIPSSAIAFLQMGISDIQRFKYDYGRYLQYTIQKAKHDKMTNDLNTVFSGKVEKTMYSLIDNEVGLIYLNPTSGTVEDNTILVIKTTSQRLAKEELMKLLQQHATTHNNNIESYISSFQMDEGTTIPIYAFPYDRLGEYLFGPLFSKIATSYFSFVDNYLIMASNKKVLTNIIATNIRQQTIDKDLEFQDMKDNLSESGNLYFFAKWNMGLPLFQYFLTASLVKPLEKHIAEFRHFYGLAYQLTGNDKMLYNTVLLSYSSSTNKRPHTVWETHLDTAIAFKPKLVVNHKTLDKEIFVQDLKNNIYLINSSGRILWKQPIGEPIMSEIYQVDFYKNNKLQYLFNTKHKIYLIDRNGNNVEHYPVALRSPATNGLALFDYDKTRNYRIFIATEDHRVYLYDLSGKILPGWNFSKTDGVVNLPVQHFRVQDKDFIVFADSLRVYILNRRGEERLKPNTHFAKSPRTPFYLSSSGNSLKDNALVTTDIHGTIYSISLEGKVFVKEMEEFSPNHYFILKNLDHRGGNEYIYLDGNKLMVYNRDKSERFSYEFDNPIDKRPVVFTFPNNVLCIGVCDTKAGKVYLFNSNGELYEDFPLDGSTLFSIGHFKNTSSQFNLITGEQGGFLYNYLVN